MASRRRLLSRVAAAVGISSLAGCTGSEPSLDLPPNPRADSLPALQHDWVGGMRTDEHGNPLLPRFHRVLMLDATAPIDDALRERVERACRALEAAYDWSSADLLHTWAWGTGYFEKQGSLGRAPIRRPRVLSRTDDPDLRSFDAALVLASDTESHLTATEAALFGDRDTLGGAPVEAPLGDLFDRRRRVTGFMGEGLPAAHADAEGIPEGAPLDGAPGFMGFRSGRVRTQASLDRVTKSGGRWDGGTTMHLSHLTFSLDGWYAMDMPDRVARMFSPDVTPEEAETYDTDVPFADAVREHARDYGVVGHTEKMARARENGEPILLRRDFNTVDGGRAGLHFLSYQRSLADFETARDAMNGWWLRDDHPSITDRQNNGLLNFVTVRSRANFYVPPRARRATP
ncbi:DUF7405 family protein [Halosegnis marinus]|uniref:Tat pathway signal protein n=1 Tax=Halosegnis marinus TaxID=3034023 RepID=A0ABD5ZKE6_9EURY|nr:hypothetical protein [Halosegnis sp. DT85]